MFPPCDASFATRFTVQGVPVDAVWMEGTRVYFPIVADWIDEELKLARSKRGRVRRQRRDHPLAD
jgi:hypothetical protein